MNSHVLHLPYLFFGLKGEKRSLPDGDEDEVCIANIGPRERQGRFLFGVIMFVISVATAAFLIFQGVDRGWRLGRSIWPPSAFSKLMRKLEYR
jgi:hypothetical protein